MTFTLAMRVTDQKPLILAVDDNQDNLVLLGFQLQALVDCSVLTADCGETALTLMEQNQIDLVLLDIVLPDINGMDITRRLRSHPPTATVPIVALTASARSEDRDRILDAGCDDYLAKPYDLDDLEVILHRHLKCRSHP